MNSAKMINIPTIDPATMKEVAIVLRSSKAWPVRKIRIAPEGWTIASKAVHRKLESTLESRCPVVLKTLAIVKSVTDRFSKFLFFGAECSAAPMNEFL